jgi:hypothetical protein
VELSLGGIVLIPPSMVRYRSPRPGVRKVSIAHLYRSDLKTAPASAADPPYEMPKTRYGAGPRFPRLPEPLASSVRVEASYIALANAGVERQTFLRPITRHAFSGIHCIPAAMLEVFSLVTDQQLNYAGP